MKAWALGAEPLSPFLSPTAYVIFATLFNVSLPGTSRSRSFKYEIASQYLKSILEGCHKVNAYKKY